MTTYLTGNPVGSADPRDLYDNAQVIDDYANSEADTTTDRLGVERATIAGIDAAARSAIAQAGYEFVGDYAAGIELTAYNQVVRDTSGEFWRVSGSTALPYITTGAGLPEGGAFVTVGDAALRNDLAAGVAIGQGALLVRGSVIYVDTIADLQALPVGELVDGQQVIVREANCVFAWSSTSEMPADDLKIYAPSASPGRWLLKGSAVEGSAPLSTSSGKCIVRVAQYSSSSGATLGSRYWVISGDSYNSGGYKLFELRRGVRTNTGSLGGDAEFLRVTKVEKLESAWVGRHEKSAVSDAAHWTENTYTPPATNTLYSTGEAINKYWSIVGAGAVRWIEFNVPFNNEGEANIQLYTTPASATDAEISIDGAAVEVVNLSSAAAEIYRHKLHAAPGFHTVRVSQGASASGTLNVFGSNYGEVRDYPSYRFPSGLVCWGDGTLWTNAEGANDYAVQESSSALFGGSFHGGETLNFERFIINNESLAIGGAITLCETIDVVQNTTIDWAPSANSSLDVNSMTSFRHASSYELSCTFDGDVQAVTFYTAMHTTPSSFTEITTPAYYDLSGLADGFKSLPRTNIVQQNDPTAGLSVITEVALFDFDYKNPYGGPAVRKVSGAYNKLYYGPFIGTNSPVKISALHSYLRKVFF